MFVNASQDDLAALKGAAEQGVAPAIQKCDGIAQISWYQGGRCDSANHTPVLACNTHFIEYCEWLYDETPPLATL
jgi:hypothetical protein